MTRLQISIELISESIFSTGESENIGADIEILRDDIGIPYLKGKTFKGKLREEAETLKIHLMKFSNGNWNKIFMELFGVSGSFNAATLKFSDCRISQILRGKLGDAVNKGLFTKANVLSALTEYRTFTKLDINGIAEDGSLRQARVIKKGLMLYCDVESIRELTPVEKGFLAAATAALRNLGAMESRGKGSVICKLLENGQDVTEKYIKVLEAEV